MKDVYHALPKTVYHGYTYCVFLQQLWLWWNCSISRPGNENRLSFHISDFSLWPLQYRVISHTLEVYYLTYSFIRKLCSSLNYKGGTVTQTSESNLLDLTGSGCWCLILSATNMYIFSLCGSCESEGMCSWRRKTRLNAVHEQRPPVIICLFIFI